MADVESLSLKVTANVQSAKKNIDSLIDTLDRLKQATAGGCGLGAVSKELGKINNTSIKFGSSFNNSSKSLANFGTKAIATVYSLKKVTDVVGSWITESNNYVENLNLFTVAMGEYAGDAQRYAEQVGEVMGIDPSDWMRNQGVFMTLGTGFGVTADRAAVMSQQLTQLGYDISSFFNIPVEDAMRKLQSGVSGELEPLRRLGYDLSQAKLEATALSLGIDKAVSSMTQAEKAELRYYAIMNQVTTAQGDMARTLDAPANQLRILEAQISQAARALGNIFIPALNAILPYAIAAVKVIRLLANAIASLVGFTLPEVDYSNITSGATNASGALDEATGSAKKLRKTLLGIDELNVLSDNSSGSGGADYGGGGFDFELPTYDFIGDAANSKINMIVEQMKEWLGITGEIDSWSDLLHTRFGEILTTAGLIGAAFAAWKLTNGFISAIDVVRSIMANPVQSLTIGAILTLTGFAISFEGMGDAIKNGLDGFNFGEIVGGSLLATGGAAILGANIAAWLDTAFALSPVTLAIAQAGMNLGLGTMAAAGAALAAGAAAIVAGIPTYFVGIYDAIKNGINWMNGLLIPLGATAAGAGIGAIIGSMGGPIGAGVGALIGLAIGLLTDFGIWLWQHFDDIEKWFKGLPKWGKVVATVVGAIIAAVLLCQAPLVLVVAGVVAFLKKWEDVRDFLSGAAQWFKAQIVDPIIAYFQPFYDAFQQVKDHAVQKFNEIKDGVISRFMIIWNKIVEIKDKIVEIFSALWWAFQTYCWKPIVDKVAELYNKHVKPVLDAWKAGFLELWNAAKAKFIDPLLEKIKAFQNKMLEVRDFVAGVFEKIGKGVVDNIAANFKSVINGVLYLIETRINSFIRLLNSAIGIINMIPGVSISRVSTLSIPRLADGGMVNEGQMFIAREAGPEMVGSIGNRTAVVNNDQIVESVSRGVYQAVVSAMGQSGGTQVVEAKVNDKVLFEVIVDRGRQETMRTGHNPLLGGA